MEGETRSGGETQEVGHTLTNRMKRSTLALRIWDRDTCATIARGWAKCAFKITRGYKGDKAGQEAKVTEGIK